MKKMLAVMLLLLCCIACTVNEEDRLIPVESIEISNNVLLEDFTGQNCLNCPNAHQEIENILSLYPDNVIAVSIHGGPFSIPHPAGLGTIEGNEYVKKWNVSAFPNGMINRTGELTPFSAWNTIIREELQKQNSYDIKLQVFENTNSNINIVTTIYSNLDKECNLQLWIVENNIVGLQNNLGKIETNYIHNHVFRNSINGTWGEKISLIKNETLVFNHSYNIDEKYDINNLSIIGFIYDNERVLNVTKIKL